jgi:hypothetical protein
MKIVSHFSKLNSNLHKFYNLQQFESKSENGKDFHSHRAESSSGPAAQCRHDPFAQYAHGPRSRGHTLQAGPADETGEVPGHGARRQWWPIPGKPTMKGCGN